MKTPNHPPFHVGPFAALLLAASLLAGPRPAGAAAPGDEAAAPAPSTAAPPTPKLGQYALPDPFLHMTAWTFVAPADWRRSGGVYWTGRLTPLAYYSDLTVANPNGSEQLRLFPQAIYVATQNRLMAAGRPMAPYVQADECVRRILLPKYRPQAHNLRVVAVDRQPRQLVVEAGARVGAQGGAQCDIRAARMLLEYEEAGRQMREMFFCTLLAPPARGPTTWCIDRALGLRAEKEKFEQAYRLLGLMASSLQENQRWVIARGRQLRTMIPPPASHSGGSSGSGGPSILDVSRSISRNSDEFLKNIDSINTQRLNLPGTEAWGRAFNNTENMVNPSTGEQMGVTGGYLQYYQDYAGRIYGSNDPTDFYQQLKLGGTTLQPAPTQ
jgi:hypothetical protein